MRYILGIDQGGSKTHGILAEETGRILGLVRGPGLSAPGVDDPVDIVESVVQQLLQETGLRTDQIHTLVAGISGIDWPGDDTAMEQTLRSRLGIEDVQTVNDCIIALHTGTSNPQSAVLCVGSGANCAVRNGDDLFVYGFYVPDEHQGGLALGLWAVQAVMDAEVGLIPETSLKAAILEHLREPSVDALLKRRSECKITTAEYLSLPPVLEKCALEGDEVALSIWRKYGKILAGYATTRIRLMGMEEAPVDVVLSGSIFKCRIPEFIGTVIQEILAQVPKAKIIPSVFEPIVGTVVMGLHRLHGHVSADAEENLHRSAAHYPIRRIKEVVP